eukprot:266936-Prymnesium_polylepis.1
MTWTTTKDVQRLVTALPPRHSCLWEQKPVPPSPPRSPLPPAPPPFPPAIPPVRFPELVLGMLDACAGLDVVGTYHLQGVLAHGRSYYRRASTEDKFLYYDESCDGSGNYGTDGWVVGFNAPNISKRVDVDSDHMCQGLASITATELPLGTRI